MKNLLIHFILFSTILIISIALFYKYGKNIWYPYYKQYSYKEHILPCKECEPCNSTKIVTIEKECQDNSFTTTEENLTSEQKLKHHLADSDFIVYPKKLTIIGLKHEKRLEVWGEQQDSKKYVKIATYPFTAFSGILSPKLKEGDRQIPEGIYKISYLNPNSKFHLSMRINYPNEFDKKMAKKEGRTNLGGDIMIHGSNRTIGCIPIGDEKIEELYFLAQKVGIQNINVILSPVDFRQIDVKIKSNKHPWISKLYKEIKEKMKPFQ